MNRHQLLACISAELQTAMKTYTHDDLPRTVTDTAAIDVLAALREGLRIDTVEQLDALPDGTAVLDDMTDVLVRHGNAWLLAGFDGLHLPILPARVIHNPDWETK